MTRRLNDKIVAKQAIANSGGGAAAAIVATKVNATGFSRARFIVNMSNAAGTASLSTGFGVWKASTSGATYTAVTTAAVANTSGVISAGTNNVIVIDVPVTPAAPWLQLSGSFVDATPAHGAVVELYNGVNNPPTHEELQVIVA